MNAIYTYTEIVTQLSEELKEPEWLLKCRLKALESLDKLKPAKIERLDYSNWHLWEVPLIENKVGNSQQKNNKKSCIDSEVLVLNFKEAILEYEELFKEIYKQTDLFQFDDFFNAFTTAFRTNGLFIYIPENIKVEQVIELAGLQEQLFEKVSNQQVLIYAAPNASVEIIESYVDRATEKPNNTNVFVQIIADAGASVQYSSLDLFSEETTAYIKRIGKTAKDARINWAVGAMSDGDVVEDVRVDLEGEGSVSDVKIVSLCHEEQVQGINVNIVNRAPNTMGNIFQHGVALDRSTIIFNGIGHILKGAKNSDAQQESRVLMLSDDARADANPILLIDEYEVQAGHAASVSRVDREQLYYLMSRGLEQTQAEKLMIRGFLSIVLSEISIKEVEHELIEAIERKLTYYGN